MLIQVLIIFGVIIVALILVFRLVFRRDLDAALGRLKKLQEEAILKENHLREELERAKVERAFQVEQGKEEGRKIVERARQESEAVRSELRDQADSEKKDIIAAGGEEVEKMQKNFTKEVDDEALKFAVALIRETFTAQGKEYLQHELVKEFFDNLEKVEKERFFVKTNKGILKSSIALSAEEKRRLDDILATKVSAKIQFQEEVDPALIAGVVIKIGDFVIDGSLKNKFNKAIPGIRKP